MQYSYGVDVGGTKIELAVYDQSFKRVDALRVATPDSGYDAFLETLLSMVLQKDSQYACCASVGVGVPCRFDDDRNVYSVNIPYLDGIPLASDLSHTLERPVSVENDSKAFAFSEYFGGAANGKGRVLGLILGTGVAGGMVVSGSVLAGRQGVAGEFGHTPIAATVIRQHNLPIRDCPCGLQGCYEQYLAGPALLWLAQNAGYGFVSVVELVAALEAGDMQAQRVMAVYRDILAGFLAKITLFYDPDVIVLGGGLSNIRTLYSGLNEEAQKYILAGATLPPVVSPRFGDASGSRGIAILGREAFTNGEKQSL